MPIYFSRNYIKIFEILIFGVGVCTCYVRQCHIEEDRDMTDYGIGGPGDAIDVLTESSVQCGSLCLHEKVCISFFFNTATKACKGMASHVVNTPIQCIAIFLRLKK